MADDQTTKALNAFLDQFDFKSLLEAESKRELGVHLTLLRGYPEKYRTLQRASGKKFGKLLQMMVMAAIDRANAELIDTGPAPEKAS